MTLDDVVVVGGATAGSTVMRELRRRPVPKLRAIARDLDTL